MILTESEARTKWCPFARALVAPTKGDIQGDKVKSDSEFVVGIASANRNLNAVGFGNVHACCIASDCMAWRRAAWVRSQADVENGIERGYCGLAGAGDV